MSRNDRPANLSPNERSRTKSQSSTRSQRTTPNVNIREDDVQRVKTSSRTSQRSTREAESGKRSESSASTRSTKTATPSSPKSKRQRSHAKTPTSPKFRRRSNSRRKKSAISTTESERQHMLEQNDDENQNLTASGLAMVPAEIFQMLNLRRLILANNNLSGLPPAINSLVNLEYLDISNNPLVIKNGHDDYSCFPKEFRHLKNLKTLLMSDCRVKHIPVAVWFVVSLQTLDVSRNKVGFIMSEIGNLIDLRHLHLSHMNLDTLPPEIGFCDRLETLDISANPIDNLPETLVECRQLYELKINFKTFYKLLDPYMLQLIDEGKIRSEHIPQVIFELENLSLLDLSETKTNSIPFEHTLRNLTELYLSKNYFFDIPEGLCNLRQLKLLDLSHNRLTIFPEYFIRLQSLETLILTSNKLPIVPKSFGHLPVLKTLLVNRNQIHTVEKEIAESSSLLRIDLSYNQLTFIPLELCSLKQLESLDLRYNKIEHLPLILRQMIGLKSMNLFDDKGKRTGLHLSGNPVTDPPPYIWKSTEIQTLFNYFEDKEKYLAHSYYHLKMILIGAKNVGKTTFAGKLVDDRRTVTKTRKTLDTFVAILQERNPPEEREDVAPAQATHDFHQKNTTSSIDQWIDNRISTSEDQTPSHASKVKRLYPPPVRTYHSKERNSYLISKSTLITKNNFYGTILDLTSEPTYEILYPLIYDSKALYLLPVNLTNLMFKIQAEFHLEELNENEDFVHNLDIDRWLTDEWLEDQLFRYLKSLSNHNERLSIAIIGLLDRSKIEWNNPMLYQTLFDQIQIKVHGFVNDPEYPRSHIRLYSDLFSTPLYLDDIEMSSAVIPVLERLAEQWNILHHKEIKDPLRRRFDFIPSEAVVVDYDGCSKRFEMEKNALPKRNHFDRTGEGEDDDESDEEIDEDHQLLVEELDAMTFDQCLDYLQLIGEIHRFGPPSQMMLIFKPYYLLNHILAKTIFRPAIDQWLDYDLNHLFRFSGFYRNEEQFRGDCERLFRRGEFTWNMLNILFFEQNYDPIALTEQNLIDYCRLMERLQLGYLNQTNTYYHEFSVIHFVCPWFMKEETEPIDPRRYFKSLEQNRQYEVLRIERSRRVKQQQLWFSMDNPEEQKENESNTTTTGKIDFVQRKTPTTYSIDIPDLPLIEDVQVFETQILNSDPIETLKISTNSLTRLPSGLYERLLICLHPLFHERLDHFNRTLGRTIDKNLLEIERSSDHTDIRLHVNQNLIAPIQTILSHSLFSFYPSVSFQIETIKTNG